MTHPEPSPVNYCPVHGDLLVQDRFGRNTRSDRCADAHSIAQINALVAGPNEIADAIEKLAESHQASVFGSAVHLAAKLGAPLMISAPQWLRDVAAQLRARA
ncbi:hypothetical protein EDF62_1586 [Leucobacter luti]|uniref:Uncharacterized protein n=1 Tax=Leucobacter luti TaxID=340320 RepID=A0A4R6RYY0_9MICO|nr:hypothetical protein [Leucobacter luti]TDP92379.1 hypothetical protein EDF62_1586 [Leucobacter luti]